MSMARTVRIRDVLDNRILVTRQSARKLEPKLASMAVSFPERLELDFSGIDGITPSFLDEILGIIQEHLARKDDVRIVIVNAPTRLSSKFAAIGRARDLTMAETETGSWIISYQGDAKQF